MSKQEHETTSIGAHPLATPAPPPRLRTLTGTLIYVGCTDLVVPEVHQETLQSRPQGLGVGVTAAAAAAATRRIHLLS